MFTFLIIKKIMIIINKKVSKCFTMTSNIGKKKVPPWWHLGHLLQQILLFSADGTFSRVSAIKKKDLLLDFVY